MLAALSARDPAERPARHIFGPERYVHGHGLEQVAVAHGPVRLELACIFVVMMGE
jgi:hypothetical protein